MRLVYVADPMCSWCYGFGPQLADLRARLADSLGTPVPLTLITGGLRPGQREPLAAAKRDEILHHWHAVAERSGMPFNHAPDAAMCREGFVYDTEPACRAVVMAREHWGETDERVLACFHAIQQAFYAEGRDTTRPEVLREIAIAGGLPADHVDAVFDSEALRSETREDFRLSRRWGITGFPSLLAEQDGTLYQIGRGYAPSVALYARAVEVLAQHPAPDAG
ncbi:DsbA family protein [Ralstonia solanacearum]|uniref:DsbA family protein n=1 Tax=Ralstonia solanacearum TaxID=305 RepID=UPI002305BC21|nr:DsbA family protein [Ralstonia solanacearum]MDB0565207.1 DsbA family protein [Ralstonia solanacearum]MDB0574760.1 DsbA family protein [Ralstonia solanacearum]